MQEKSARGGDRHPPHFLYLESGDGVGCSAALEGEPSALVQEWHSLEMNVGEHCAPHGRAG